MNERALQQQECPLCGGAARTWGRRFNRELRRCRSCRFAWVTEGLMRAASGRSIYEEEIPQFVTQYADYYRDDSTVDAARDKLRWVASYVPPGGRLLDVGANFGYFAREAAAQFDVLGLEPGPSIVEWGRRNLGAPLEVGSIYESRPEFARRFDVITMFDVIEHVPDPRSALEQCRRYVADAGHLFISTPNTDSPMARLLGSRWYYVDLIQHIALFNADNLSRLLRDAGFTVVATRTIGRRYRFSYIEARLRELAAENPALTLAHLATQPLRLLPGARISLNFGDVLGVVARAS